MKRFFVRFQVETLASLAGRIGQQQAGRRPVWKFSWKSDDARLILYDVLHNKDGVLVHEGLGLDLDVPGSSIDEAIGRAQNLGEGLVNLVAYASASACKPAALISCYEIPQARADVDVAWFHQRSRTPVGDLRPVDEALLSTVYALYDEADEDAKWQVSQATQWLRKGSLELETIGQFIAYWEGLEAASKRLLDLLCPDVTELLPICPKCKDQVEKCPKCGKGLGRQNDMAGVAKLFEQSTPGGEEMYKHIRANRGRLFHGGKRLKPEFLKALREDVRVLREALSRAIGVCLGLEEAAIRRIAGTQPRRATRPIKVKVFGTLTAFQAPELGYPDLQPFVEHEPEEEYSVTPEGKLSVAFKHTLTVRNASFQARGYEMWGDEHARAAD